MLYVNPRYLLLPFALILFCVVNATAQVITIEGRVRTPQGEPISGVRVDRLAKTDDTGHFKIAADFLRYWNTLWIDKKGFVPKLVSISPTPSTLDITLEPEKETSVLDVPRCSDAKVKGSRFVGRFLRLTVPKELKFKTGVDTDYVYYHIGYAKNGKTGWLRGGLGNVYGDAYPPGEILQGLEHYSYRRTSFGIDWRGVTKDGKYWRYFGALSLFDIYDYETDSKEAADVFDKILDGICYQFDKDR
ncbi:MAG TPA: carboxypeptidase-like regulatory domain-containing protein [Pyrinomonadaceae bacterium]|nr:carboxypeptidase-like regulatory domain-containing protein [Pyrinomonadaceae bacterium]